VTIGARARLGPYEVLSRLGAGGMGEVWRARDSRLNRDVAIKVLPTDLGSDAGRLKRFEKEARSASALNHPNIVTIYDIGESDSVSWIAMELVEGKTLRELLFAGSLPVKRVLAIAAQVADGLGRAHEAGIVHRDLKPENVMVTKDGRVKILDFGLAKLTYTGVDSGEATNLQTDTGTGAGVILGTVGYMSPEQASGQPVDYRSDQFSFGSILYELATGKRAFQKKTAVDTLSAILNDEPESMGAVNPQAPTPLRWIVERCLGKDPEARYASTKDLAHDLASVRDHLSEAFVSVTPSRDVPRLRAATVALVLLGVLAIGIFAGRPLWKAKFASRPTLRQVTFRRAGLGDARFAPDGQIVYAQARSDGKLFDLLSSRPGTPESRSLGLPPANLLSISSSGELAILVGGTIHRGTLATVPLAGGGAPREVLENVRWADWAPDGKNLAVIHVVEGKPRLEFPLGRVLYEARGLLNGGCWFSPKGDRIALSESGGWPARRDLTVVDLAGKRRKIAKAPYEFRWSPRGDEIWFNEIGEGTTTLQAVSLSGRRRLVASFPGDFSLNDVSRDGRVLLGRESQETEILGGVIGEPEERNLSWLDGSEPADLSTDGKTLLFTETYQGGGPNRAVYKRKTDGSPAVRLGDGLALALSPDGLWALSRSDEIASRLVLLPTGPGQPRTLSLGQIQMQGSGQGSGTRFFPDGKRILVHGAEPGHGSRLYVFDIESGKARPVTPEGVPVLADIALSPDGKFVVSPAADGKNYLYDVEGGPARLVPGLSGDFFAIRWCSDGHSLFVGTGGAEHLEVSRLDLSSGRRQLWKTFSVPVRGSGVIEVIPTPDGRSYVYGYTKFSADLFIADGLK